MTDIAISRSLPAQRPQVGATETYSSAILGPAAFTMTNLRVAGRAGSPLPPNYVAPAQSPYIIAGDEVFDISVDIEFVKNPLTELLMCLGTRVKVDFVFEGYGSAASEIDLSESLKTEKGKYAYTVTYTGIPNKVGLKSGLYEIGAVAEIGPVENACSTKIFGHGYLAEILLEVYPAGQDLV